MMVPLDILLAAATVVAALSIASIVGGWAGRRFSPVGMVALMAAAAIAAWVHSQTPGGLAWHSVPDAFISVVARIVN